MSRSQQQSRKSSARSHACSLEPLESRRLMSATLSSGLLTVTGSAAADLINVSYSSSTGKLKVTEQQVGTTLVKATEFVASQVSKILVNALAGDDRVTLPTNISKPSTVNGGGGHDTLTGGNGADLLRGGIGNDVLDGRGGSDVAEGGDGTDLLNYANRTANLRVTLDGVANDTGAGGTDNVKPDVENVTTGSGNDYVFGSNVANRLSTGAGNDSVFGGNHNGDVVFAGAGSDTILQGVGGMVAYGGDGNDTITGGNNADATTWLYGDAGDDRIRGYGFQNVIYGGDGNDHIQSFGSGMTWAYGGAGNDQIWGGQGANALNGDDGDDVVRAAGAMKNWVHGGAGNDRVYGTPGGNAASEFTEIRGGDGNDQLFGGMAPDKLHGENGDDVLVSLGGGTDTLYGNAGFDSFWHDPTDVLPESIATIINEVMAGNFHSVSGFKNFASKELLGQDIADPTDAGTTTDLSHRPLFSTAGPTRDDVHQGGVGNCGTMAVLGSIAAKNPNRIRQSIVDLGDGTYAAQFITNGAIRFIRLDADLPYWTAGDGAGGSIWVRMLEKAFAIDRSNTYASTASRWMSDVFRDFGRGPTEFWSSAWTSGMNFLDIVRGQLGQGKAVTVSTPGTITGGAPLVGGHAYEVVSVFIPTLTTYATLNTTAKTTLAPAAAPGAVAPNLRVIDGTNWALNAYMVLRNPWGTDGGGSDGNNDGYITVSVNQIMGNFVTIQSAHA